MNTPLQNEFLAKYIEGFYLHFSDEIAAIKGADLKYIASSNKFAQLVGFESAAELLGKTDQELFSTVARFYDKYSQQDLKIMACNKKTIHLSINQFATGHAGYIYNKTPIIYPLTDKCLGVKLVATPMFLPNLLQLIFKTNNLEQYSKNKLDENAKDIRITTKQRMVLFLYLNRFSNAQISVIMTKIGYTMSTSRVNAHLSALRELLGVRNKSQLIDKAIELNLNTFVPKELFKAGLYEIKKSQIHLI